MESGTKDKVCVTGGNGFIGSWLIKSLLERGYSVTTTVKLNPGEKIDFSFLTNLPGASERLEIYSADLDEPQSFSPAIEGCVGVFHLAAPIDFEGKEPDEVLIKRSVDGTLGVLNVCLQSKTVRRVVHTSSISAVLLNHYSEDDVLDESFWSDIDFIKENSPLGISYPSSKTLTEKAVLEFSEQNGLEVVTLLPAFVTGPFICPNFPTSVALTLALILGEEEEYGLLSKISLVHVDDVARAFIFLFEHPNAKGRFICAKTEITLEEIATLLSAKYPEFQIPSLESLKDVEGFKFNNVSSKKLMDAGFEFKHGIDEMFDGAIKSCKEKGYL